MMMWNKIKIVGAMACLLALAGTGAGWLAGGRGEAEESPSAAEPPVNKDTPRAAPNRNDLTKDEIAKIHAEMDLLAKKERLEEEKLSKLEIEARLRLAESQDDLHLKEREWDFEREEEQGRLKDTAQRITELERRRNDIIAKLAKKSDESEIMKALAKRLVNERETLRQARDAFLDNERNRHEQLRPFRKRVFQAEHELHRIEVRQARLHEDVTAKRQGFLSRLQQLQEASLRLEPMDRLRDVERKLDALHRDVGELRRALERQGNDSRHKP